MALTHAAHRKPSTAPPAKILPTHISGSIKKEMASMTFESPAAVYSAATPPLVNHMIAVTDTSSSLTSELLKIIKMLLQKEKTGTEHEADRCIGILSYKSKRERDLYDKA